MGLGKTNKKLIKRLARDKGLAEIEQMTGVSEKEIVGYLREIWGEIKFNKRFGARRTVRNEFSLPEVVRKNWYVIAGLVVLIFLVYVNSLGNEFLSDDIAGIRDNPNIASLKYALAQPFHFVTQFSYYLIYKLFGLSPVAFRMQNVLLHVVVATMVFIMVYRLLGKGIAVVSSVIFAVHPLAIESVAWISGGSHVQYTLFTLLAFWFFIESLEKRGLGNYLLVGLFSWLAFSTSEKALALFGLELFYFISFPDREKWKSLIIPLVITVFFGLYYFGQVGGRATDLQANFSYEKAPTQNPFITIPIALTEYIRLFFFPVDLALYRSEMNFSHVSIIVRQLITVLGIAGSVWLYLKQRKFFFWFVFFPIALSPTLLPFGLSWVVAERYVYPGLIALCVMFAYLLYVPKNQDYRRYILPVIVGLLVLLFGVRTIIRNVDWKNQDNLWLASALTSPSSPNNHNNLGDLYSRRGQFEKAAEEFKIAIRIKPNYADAYHNLANTYYQMGDLDRAVENYKKAVSLRPTLFQSYQNLGSISFARGDFRLALDYFNKALTYSPGNPSILAAINQTREQIGY